MKEKNKNSVKRWLISLRSFIIAVKIIEWITSSSHDSVKLIKVKHSITISVSLFQHFLQLFIWNFLTNFTGNSFQVFECDFVQIVFVKKFEYFVNLIFWIPGAHSGSHDSNEFIVTDSLLDVLSHFRVNVSDILFFYFHSESFHDGFEFSCIDLSYIFNEKFYLYFCYQIFWRLLSTTLMFLHRVILLWWFWQFLHFYQVCSAFLFERLWFKYLIFIFSVYKLWRFDYFSYFNLNKSVKSYFFKKES